jgi:hypothetical protein
MRRIRKALLLAFLTLLYSNSIALADPPGIVTGTQNLLQAATTWLLLIIPTACACAIGWHAFCKQLNEGDPAQSAMHSRAMKNALITGAIGVSAVGIVKAVLAFYSS